MTPRQTAPDPEQGSFWTTQEAHFLTSDQRGAATDLHKRAEAMGKLMSMLNEDNRAHGGSKAINQEPHRSQMASQYGSPGTAERVMDRAQAKAEERIIAEKYQFAIASGMYAMVNAGFDKDEVQQTSRDLFGEFLQRYGVGQADAAKRNKATRQIQRSTEKITGRKISRK